MISSVGSHGIHTHEKCICNIRILFSVLFVYSLSLSFFRYRERKRGTIDLQSEVYILSLLTYNLEFVEELCIVDQVYKISLGNLLLIE